MVVDCQASRLLCAKKAQTRTDHFFAVPSRRVRDVDFLRGVTRIPVLEERALVVWPHLHVLMVVEAAGVIDLETYATSATSQAIGQPTAQTKVMEAERALEEEEEEARAKVNVHETRRVVNLTAVTISVDFQELFKDQVRGTHHTKVSFNG